MTFYWRYSGQEHAFSDIPELLTIGLLEEDHNEYLYLMVTAAHNNIDISHILNSTSTYDNWFSSHPISLALLVGSLTDQAKSYNISYSFYGRYNSEGIPDEDGCTILELMVTLGADLSLKNYYGNDIKNIIESTNSIYSREKNNNFKALVNSF